MNGIAQAIGHRDAAAIGGLDRAMGVTHVVLSLDCGGLERIVVDLVREGSRLGDRPSVLCLDRPGRLAAEVEAMGVPVISLNRRGGLNPALILRIRRALTRLDPDVVHTHQIGALLYAGPAAQALRGTAVVHTEHGDHIARRPAGMRRGRARLVLGLASRFADRFICVSDAIAATVSAPGLVPAGRVAVVPNGIDTDRFAARERRDRVRAVLGLPEGARLIGTVGRLDEVKCQDALIGAFAQVSGRHPDAHLVLVGDGPMRSELEGLSDRLGLSARIHFAGYRPKPEDYLSAMDIFALTSRTEGMPLSVLEAWAAGLPVVASRVGGLPKLVEQGRTGLLFPAGDVDRLANCFNQLLEDPEAARSLGESGRDEVRSHYSLARMAQTYARHYREVCRAATLPQGVAR